MDDRRRVAALARYGVADTPDEPVFDALAQEAARTFAAPFALVTFIDADRQWIKARVGVDLRIVPRCMSFCTHSIQRGDVMVVSDCLLDPRFVDNPFVTGEPHVRFYAGTPIKTPEGARIGTVCIFDVVPRAAMNAHDQRRLGALAAKAMAAVAERWRNLGVAA